MLNRFYKSQFYFHSSGISLITQRYREVENINRKVDFRNKNIYFVIVSYMLAFLAVPMI